MNEKQIQQVLEIEKQSQEIHAKAQREAQELPSKAEQEAQALIAKAKADAEEEARKLIAQAQAEGAASDIVGESDKKNADFEAQSKKNFDKAVAYVLDRVTGKA
jgi:vacuolar-type H+-ATPase subunit H